MQAVAGQGFPEPMPGIEAPMSERVAACVHGFVAGSNAVLALVQADDLAMETVAINAPRTGKERTNWRRKLREPVQTRFVLGSARAILDEVRRKRKTPCYTGMGKTSVQVAVKLARLYAADVTEPWRCFDV